MNPQSCTTFPLGVTIHHLAKAIKSNIVHERITQELKYKRRRIKYITHHNLNIVSKSIRSQQTQHSNNRKLNRCLNHVWKLTRSRKWSTKRGGEHHIAIGHGPMVQGGLLTAHPGGVHGGGWSPGGGSSFWQGVREASPGSPDLETAAAAVQRGEWE